MTVSTAEGKVTLPRVDVLIVFGSSGESDRSTIVNSKLKDIFDTCGITVHCVVCSAHRNRKKYNEKVRQLLDACEVAGIRYVVGVAGMSAILPGVLSSEAPEEIVVWGVPVEGPTERDTKAALSAMIDVPEGVAINVCGIGKKGATGCALQIARTMAAHHDGARSGLHEFLQAADEKKPFVEDYNPWAPRPGS